MRHHSARFTPILVLGSLALAASLAAGFILYRSYALRIQRTARLMAWLRNPGAHPGWKVTAGERCNSAPFLMPTNGYIGFLWDDSFRLGHRHQGLDIFGGQQVGQTPVLAAYSGYLTRLPDWKSSVILRIPEDPLNPSRQIWTYYTHMADQQGRSFISPQFPPGTSEMYVSAGTLLGYQGNFSGTPGNPTGVHLHFSIVKDDGAGSFRNELKIENTLDPSPYLGLALNANSNREGIPTCPQVAAELGGLDLGK
jgi:murein DD-endopeptidase MepM/ murein hydrolase activator NlpD